MGPCGRLEGLYEWLGCRLAAIQLYVWRVEANAYRTYHQEGHSCSSGGIVAFLTKRNDLPVSAMR